MLITEKFKDPKITAKGEERAHVALRKLETLWFNTGTQCNLSCENCYIESNPKNDRLVFLTKADVEPYLDEILDDKLGTQEIGYTGGEPFLNPNMIEILQTTLEKGFPTLVLTNAYRLMNRYKSQLTELNKNYPDQLTLRVSLDHFTNEIHESERGQGTFEPTLKACKWIYDAGIPLAVAGRALVNEDPAASKEGYYQLFKSYQIDLDVDNKEALVVFPEMNETRDVPEITTSCWEILNKSPDSVMCSNSRMVVRRKDEPNAKVLACTLLAYDKQFEMGDTLGNSKKSVQLNHQFCAQFCVLGGASCS